jgi:histidinol-phosphate aminotransferase
MSLLVLDAAYAEFVTDSSFRPGEELVTADGNLATIRTFSKVYGLAGMRVGWGYFSSGTADVIRRVIPPSSVHAAAQAAAVAAISDQPFMRATLASITAQRQRLEDGHGRVGSAPVHSETNFMLADFESSAHAKAAYAFLVGKGIYLRPASSSGLPSHLRVSIGSAEENSLLLDGLRSFLKARPKTAA